MEPKPHKCQYCGGEADHQCDPKWACSICCGKKAQVLIWRTRMNPEIFPERSTNGI
jgi:hypothetical protein